MAKKEALRGLQERLAQRLQEAKSVGSSASWLAVETLKGRYLLPLELAGEIFAPSSPMPVPHAAPWFLGVVNLRGQICGLIDLGAFLGEPSMALQLQTEGSKHQARLITLNPGLAVNSALLVRHLVGLRSTQDFINMHPAAEGSPAFYTQAYEDAQGQLWQELNLQALAEAEDFLHIAR